MGARAGIIMPVVLEASGAVRVRAVSVMGRVKLRVLPMSIRDDEMTGYDVAVGACPVATSKRIADGNCF